MRVLLIDIETSPNLAHVWRIWQENVGLEQLLVPTEMMCFAAKWYGEREVFFASQYAGGKYGEIDSQLNMVQLAHELLDEADAVVHYNGRKFDIPHLNREFLLQGLTPPSPFKQIDLLKVAQKQFNFPSNKLAYVTKALGLKGKVKHEGHSLWVKCMAGDPAAWKRMERYNRRDVTELEPLFNILRPWAPSLPNFNLYGDDEQHVCPKCGSAKLTKQGFSYTQVSKFQQWRCSDCGGWSRSAKRELGSDLRESL